MTRYVLVVHGIGEQRKNETVLSVVNRFAEARALDAGLKGDTPAEVLTLGMACGQAGRVAASDRVRPWLEFEHVPADPARRPRGPFLGEAVDSSSAGANLRFVDVHWADLLQEDYPRVGEDAVRWADSLRGRLQRKTAPPAPRGEVCPPYWAQETLRLIRDTVVLVRRALASRGLRKIDQVVFQDFLGDVQLYGEYALTRGRAVRRFHKLMAWIEAAHDRPDDPPRYTVIAHSLGTVMSLDALLYALARREVRWDLAGERPHNLPFPGYLKGDETRLLREFVEGPEGGGVALDPSVSFVDTSWIDRVDAFVTLGSPIDKYLVLWWQNYKYLTDTGWMRPDGPDGPAQRIPHFNYCDEQDPVGHKLDTVRTTPAYRAAFEPVEDEVFNRYALPGAAHVEYWKDRDLFRWILFRAVDGVGPKAASSGRSVEPPEWFEEDIYRKVLAISYKVTPYAIIALDFFTFTLAWFAKSWHASALAAVAIVVTCLIGRQLIDLTVWWRQILVAKDPVLMAERAGTRGVRGEVGEALRQAGTQLRRALPRSGTGSGKTEHRLRSRARQGAAFRGRLRATTAISVVLAALSSGYYFATWWRDFPWGRLAMFALVATVTVLVWLRLFRSRDVAWRQEGTDAGADGGEEGCQEDGQADEGEADDGGAAAAGRRGGPERTGRRAAPATFGWVDGWCTAVALGAILGGWTAMELLGRAGFFAAPLFAPLRAWYHVPDKLQSFVPDLALCVASFFVVSAIVFCYLQLRLADVERRIANGPATVGEFATYALGPPLDEAGDPGA